MWQPTRWDVLLVMVSLAILIYLLSQTALEARRAVDLYRANVTELYPFIKEMHGEIDLRKVINISFNNSHKVCIVDCDLLNASNNSFQSNCR